MRTLFAIGEPLGGKELIKTEKVVERDLRELKKAFDTIETVGVKMKPPKITAKMGRVPRKIHISGVVRQTDDYHGLPAEIQRMIWSYLVEQPDRISLALACKWDAQMYEGLHAVHAKIAIKSPKKEHRLAVLVRLRDWIPKDYRLCFMCVRYLKRCVGDEWGGDSTMLEPRWILHGRVQKDAMIRGPRCPRCKHQAAVDQLAHKSNVKELFALLKDNIASSG